MSKAQGTTPTPKVDKEHPKLKGGNVKGSNEDRAKPKQCNEYAESKKTNP